MSAPILTPTQQHWLEVRAYLQHNRYRLAVEAADLYPDVPKLAGTPLLTDPSWMPEHPVPLTGIGLSWSRTAATPPVPPMPVPPMPVPPMPITRDDGTGYASYSQLMAELAAPTVFDDRGTYRLVEARLNSSEPGLTFTDGTYFSAVDVGEAAAHEFAASRLDPGRNASTVRRSVGNPCHLSNRPANLAISCLTLRHDRRTGGAGFPLHWRDPAKVGHAGGLFQVMPVGVFQAASDGPADRENDFDLWRCLTREAAEELLGADEDHSTDGEPIDYAAWPFARQITEARDQQKIAVYCLGLGVDPLTFATDLLVAMVVDAEVYDDLFAAVVEVNAEGRTLSAAEGAGPEGRVEFTEQNIRHYSGEVPMQAAGAAVLRLAWTHRDEVFARR